MLLLQVSMPDQVKNIKTGLCGTNDIEATKDEKTENEDIRSNIPAPADVILEESVDDNGGQGQESSLLPPKMTTLPNTSKSLPIC
ncbi:uncharacterized protein LOC135204860 isoform X3 [Macrobrachium nipponense]